MAYGAGIPRRLARLRGSGGLSRGRSQRPRELACTLVAMGRVLGQSLQHHLLDGTAQAGVELAQRRGLLLDVGHQSGK